MNRACTKRSTYRFRFSAHQNSENIILACIKLPHTPPPLLRCPTTPETQMDTQPDLAIQLQRAIGHAMASQELSVPIEQAPSAKGFNLYSIAAAESGMGEAVSRPFTFKGRRLSTIKGFGGAKVVPVDGGGPI